MLPSTAASTVVGVSGRSKVGLITGWVGASSCLISLPRIPLGSEISELINDSSDKFYCVISLNSSSASISSFIISLRFSMSIQGSKHYLQKSRTVLYFSSAVPLLTSRSITVLSTSLSSWYSLISTFPSFSGFKSISLNLSTLEKFQVLSESAPECV